MFHLRKKSKTEEVLSEPIRLRVTANSIRNRLLKGVPADSNKERTKKVSPPPSEFNRLVNAAVGD